MRTVAIGASCLAVLAGCVSPGSAPRPLQLEAGAGQPYLISWFRYDPAAELRRLRVPVLVLRGTTDIQVPLTDARLLGAANPKATMTISDGMNHVMKMFPAIQAAQTSSYTDPTLPVARLLIEAIVTFVQRVHLSRVAADGSRVGRAAGDFLARFCARPSAGPVTALD